MMQRVVIGVTTLILIFLGWSVADAQDPEKTKKEAAARSAKILADDAFFTPEFAAKVETMMSRVAAGIYKEFGFALPEEERPEIAALRKKYGEPDRIDEAPRGPSGPGLPDPPVDTLYTYGHLQLGVPKSSSTGTVEWLKVISLDYLSQSDEQD